MESAPSLYKIAQVQLFLCCSLVEGANFLRFSLVARGMMGRRQEERESLLLSKKPRNCNSFKQGLLFKRGLASRLSTCFFPMLQFNFTRELNVCLSPQKK